MLEGQATVEDTTHRTEEKGRVFKEQRASLRRQRSMNRLRRQWWNTLATLEIRRKRAGYKLVLRSPTIINICLHPTNMSTTDDDCCVRCCTFAYDPGHYRCTCRCDNLDFGSDSDDE